MGANGLETILKKFSKEKIMQRYEEIYNELI